MLLRQPAQAGRCQIRNNDWPSPCPARPDHRGSTPSARSVRRRIPPSAGAARTWLPTTKSPADRPGFVVRSVPTRVGSLSVGFAEEVLERLVGLLRQIRVKLADPRRARDEPLIGRLRIVGLDFDRPVEALGAQEFLGRRAAFLE